MTIYKLILERADSNRTEYFYVEHYREPTHGEALHHLKERLANYACYYKLDRVWIIKVEAKPL